MKNGGFERHLNRMRKKKAILSILLALCLAAAMMPMSAYAAEDVSNDIVVIYTGDMHGAVDSNITLAGLKAYANERNCGSGGTRL